MFKSLKKKNQQKKCYCCKLVYRVRVKLLLLCIERSQLICFGHLRYHLGASLLRFSGYNQLGGDPRADQELAGWLTYPI